MKRMILCAGARQIDIIKCLKELGNALLKIGDKRGNLMNYSVQFQGHSVFDFMQKLKAKICLIFSFHPPLSRQQKGVNKREQVTVFEGCFAFLFYPCLTQKLLCKNRLPLPEGHAHFLVLNFLSFYKKSPSLKENHAAIHRYLDLVMVGLKAVWQAFSWFHKYKEQRLLYQQHKGIYEFLRCSQMQERKQSLKRRRHF